MWVGCVSPQINGSDPTDDSNRAASPANMSSGFSTRFDTNRVVQPQKKTTGFKFRVWEVEALSYLCTETKGANQLICAVVSAYAKSRLSHDATQSLTFTLYAKSAICFVVAERSLCHPYCDFVCLFYKLSINSETLWTLFIIEAYLCNLIVLPDHQ